MPAQGRQDRAADPAVQLGVGSYSTLSPHVLSGRAQLIAVTNPVRVPNKPELPIFAEAVPGYDSRGWFGYIGPAAIPRDIVLRPVTPRFFLQ